MYFHKDVGNLTLRGGGAARGHDPVAEPLQPLPPPRSAPSSAATRCCARWSRRASSTPAAGRGRHGRAAARRARRPSTATEAPYFVDLVQGAARAALRRARTSTTQNLSIYTTLDLQLQALAQQALRDGLDAVEKLDPAQASQRAAAGRADRARARARARCVALVGGRSYGDEPVQPRDARRAGSRAAPSSRSSTWPPSRPRSTTRRCRRSRPPPWSRTRPRCSSSRTRSTCPQNYEDKYLGYVTLRRALAHSLNVATVKVAEMVGYDRVADLWYEEAGHGAHDPALPRDRARRRSRRRRSRWPPPTTCWPTAGCKVEPRHGAAAWSTRRAARSSSTSPQPPRAACTRSRPTSSPT